jgi:Na+-driven multidrug efflux pump
MLMNTNIDESFKNVSRVTLNKVFRLWFAPALSSFVLTFEIPLVSAFVIRAVQGINSLAAFGIVFGLISAVESPAFTLISTTTALLRTRQDADKLRNFSFAIGIVLGVLIALALLTPVSTWLFSDILHLPDALIPLMKQGLWIFVPSPFVVAWRRYQQGLLIHLQKSKPIAYASWLRILFSISFIGIMAMTTSLPGIVLGSLAIVVGRTLEALILTLWSSRLQTTLPLNGQPPSFVALLRFHLPLAGTACLEMFYVPIITAGIARMMQAELSLVAFPVLYGFVGLCASVAGELEAVTISLIPGEMGKKVTCIYSMILGFILSGIMLFVVITPLSSFYFSNLSGLNDKIAALAIQAALPGLAFPFFSALRSWLRGLLLAHQRSGAVQLAMVSSLTTLIAILIVGQISARLPGVSIGMLALFCALVAEVGTLWRLSYASKGKVAASLT